VDFAFFVVEKLESRKGRKDRKGSRRGKCGGYFVLNGMIIALVAK
jgi:hypothetical protein